MLSKKSWLYKECNTRRCVELDERLFLPEIERFLFDSRFLITFLPGIKENDLKFSRVIDGIEEIYHVERDIEVLTGYSLYYPDDNCFTIYYNGSKI